MAQQDPNVKIGSPGAEEVVTLFSEIGVASHRDERRTTSSDDTVVTCGEMITSFSNMDVASHRDKRGTTACDDMLNTFEKWPSNLRMQFLQALVGKLDATDQVTLINSLSPKLRRDLLSPLPTEISWCILFYLDIKDLCTVAQVCKEWYQLQSNPFFWKKMLNKKYSQMQDWRMLSRQRMCDFDDDAVNWKSQYISLYTDLERVYGNWWAVDFDPHQSSFECGGNGIYCVQYDEEKIVTGSRDNLVKIWVGQRCIKKFSGHAGSVLCLQFDESKVISGSSDGTVRVWNIHSGECLQVLEDHSQSVLHLKFLGDLLVTCSKDKTVMLWQRNKEGSYERVRVMNDHEAAVNVVEFDYKYIVSASGDRTVRIWETDTGELKQTLEGHKRGIACLQFQGDTIVTGSSDQTLKKWSVSGGRCELTLEGHTDLVRCVRFNDRHIVSGSYDKTVRIWDFTTGVELRKLIGHQNRVFRVQFDTFKIVSSSQDDQIKIWDFYADADGTPTTYFDGSRTRGFAIDNEPVQ